MDSDALTGSAPRADQPRRDLFVFNGGFLTQRRLRRILGLAGWDIRLGKPGADDWVGVWGASGTSRRGRAVAGATGAQVLHVEDAFLRSLFPGRAGDAPLGLTLDGRGPFFDASRPSDLETLLAAHPLGDPALLASARDGMERIARAHLTKYAAVNGP